MGLKCIKELILLEQNKQNGMFILDQNINEYFIKLEKNAEFITHCKNSELAGFVAYYCNDPNKNSAFITLVLISDGYRGTGLASNLIQYVVHFCAAKGFKECSLEVLKNNEAAINLYKKLGFTIKHELDKTYLMNISFLGN